MILTGENRSIGRSNHSSAPLPITNLRRTDPWLKTSLRGERPTIKCIGQGTVLKTNINLNYAWRFSSYREANNAIPVKKIQKLLLYKEIIMLVVRTVRKCSLWVERKIFEW
jgi:hypothetical protein